MGRKKKRAILYGLIFLLLGVLGYSLYQLLAIRRDYAAEQTAHDEALRYKPGLSAPDDAKLPEGDALAGRPSGEGVDPASESSAGPQDGVNEDPTVPVIVNESIVQLRTDYPDAVGWITVPGTDVDYPFVQAADNDYYLRRGLDGKYLYAGVPFLDWRCAADFSDNNSILYGHNLRNGSMFGTLERFKKQDFFEAHREFYIYLPEQTLTVEILACVVAKPDAVPFLYSTIASEDFLSSLSAVARRCVDLSPASIDPLEPVSPVRYVTLSTCDYESDGSRVLLVGRIQD